MLEIPQIKDAIRAIIIGLEIATDRQALSIFMNYSISSLIFSTESSFPIATTFSSITKDGVIITP